jgi:hypothetical protein
LDDFLGGVSIESKRKSMKWSGREDLVLGRSFDLLAVLINRYKNRDGIVAILVSMFGGCSES